MRLRRVLGWVDGALFLAAAFLFVAYGKGMTGGAMVIIGPVATFVFVGRILFTFAWGFWVQHKYGIPMRWGYGGWETRRRSRRRR